MLDQTNKYSQKQIHIDMDNIANEHNKDKSELFKPLIIARKVLTGKYVEGAYDKWIDMLKGLKSVLEHDADELEIIYRVLAILFYRYSEDIADAKYFVEDIIDLVGLDFVEYYNHYTNEEMQYVSIRAKALDMLEKRNKILMQIADNSDSDNVRVQALKALDHYIESCLLPKSPNTMNVYGHDVAIDASTGKEVKAFDISKLQGQGDVGFKKMLNKKKGEIEEVEEMANEPVNGKPT